jgi:hypothetical protein
VTWPREYHEWEKATKNYFEGQHERNGSSKPDWKAKARSPSGAVSHVDRVRAQLMLFGGSVSEAVLSKIDSQRRLINAATHEDEYLATEQDYWTLTGVCGGSEFCPLFRRPRLTPGTD